jgi:hypothetical protein
MEDLFSRIVEDLVGRVSGSMTFRLILQPVMAAIFAIRGPGLPPRDYHGRNLPVYGLSMVLPWGGDSGCRHPGPCAVSVDPRSCESDGKEQIKMSGKWQVTSVT